MFLQQLGRGLRHDDGKRCLLVLDFIGDANRKFRFDERFRAILGGSRARVRRAIEEDFPFLPAGCEIKLDRASQRAVLDNVRQHLGSSTRDLLADLRRIGDVRLPAFLAECEIGPEELYRGERCLTNLKRAAGMRPGQAIDDEVTRALPRVLHVDDDARLGAWRQWLEGESPARDAGEPLQLMLFALLGMARRPVASMADAFVALWREGDLREEIADLLGILADRQRRPTYAVDGIPFRTHATYTRDEISAGLLEVRKGKLLRTQGGVYKCEAARADVFFVTLEKDPKHFTPTTLYKDYPVSATRFHWESQGATRADSETGRRYRGEIDGVWRTLLFVRRAKHDARGETSPYLFLGPVRYVSHESEKPMQIIWELARPMPAEFYSEVKLAG